jgi:molecular chaperone GrpE
MENKISNQDQHNYQPDMEAQNQQKVQSPHLPEEQKPHEAAQAVPAEEVAIPDLQKSLEKAQEELALANEKCLRIHAEFDNFRKRTTQERLVLIETAGEKLLEQLLPLIDDFERALSSLDEGNNSIASVTTGVKLIYDKMIQLLAQAHVHPMEIETGNTFNPELHEAISKTAVSDKALQNKIIHVVTKGYMIKDKVLRYAKVIIGE